MDMKYERREIAGGTGFTVIKDGKFKYSRIVAVFITRLSDDAAANALVPRLLTKTNSEYPTMAQFNRKLCELYNATVSFAVFPVGDDQVISVEASLLDGRFALEGEDIVSEVTKLLCGCIFSPLLENGHFPEKDIELEKQNQINDINNEINDKTYYAMRKALQAAFAGEPCALRHMGTAEQTASLDGEAVLSAYSRMIRTMPAEIVCIGDSSFDTAREMFAKEFERAGRKAVQRLPAVRSVIRSVPQSITESLDIEQSKLVLIFKSREWSKRPLLLMSAVYGGTEHSLLFSIVREKMSLCYFCFSGPDYVKGSLTVTLGVDKCNIEAAKKECIAQLDRIRDGDFSDDDIRNAKLVMINSIRSSYDTMGGLAGTVLTSFVRCEELLSREERIEEINAITREQLIAEARALVLDTEYVLAAGETEEKAE